MDSNASLKDNYKSISDKIAQAKKDSNVNKNIIFIAVSKKRSVEDIKVIYEQGHRIFGENYVNELLEKSEQLPKDIEWHLIGHLQSNKVKKVLEKENIKPFVQLKKYLIMRWKIKNKYDRIAIE